MLALTSTRSRWSPAGLSRGIPLLLVLLMVLGVVQAPPSAADNQNAYTHWGHGYRPYVSAPDPNIWTYTGEAEFGWNVNGYPNGFCVGSCSPGGACGFFNGGGITVCFANQGDPLLQGRSGNTLFQHINNPQMHIYSIAIFVCNNCGLSDNQRRIVMNHEYGHALGLGHTFFTPCVMQDPAPTKFQCSHDANAMAWTYAAHNEG